ncbi:MAG TPA: ATP-binding protein [Bacteriovoracaceae bacterium]|nr:ATP-binding protein [Bacteriovoracaceae bacterium]
MRPEDEIDNYPALNFLSDGFGGSKGSTKLIPPVNAIFDMSYLFAVISVISALGLSLLIRPLLGVSAPFLIFILPITLSAFFYGLRAGVVATVLAVVTFFIPPMRVLDLPLSEDKVQVAIFFTVGLVISVLGYFHRSKRDQLQAALTTISSSAQKQQLADQKARDLETDLAKVWRLNTLGEMATGLAHELSQPISAIKNYSLAVEKFLANEQNPFVISSVKGISAEAERAANFIHSLRSFIGSRNSERQIEEINAVISDVLVLLNSELNSKHISIKLGLAEPSFKVPIDKIQMIQVVMNLFRNSIESMSQDSKRPKEIFVGTLQQNNGVLLCVSDTGEGISQAESNRVYDAFFTTKNSGMGMGLAISKSVIEMHEGKIWHVPNEPVGTTFMIWLPSKAVT